jgi:hypothetical protein
MSIAMGLLDNANMFNVHALSPQDFVGLSPAAAADLAAQVLQHIGQQSQQIAQQSQHIESQAKAIEFKEARIQSILFELRKLKAWRFDAKTERMNAEQRQLFEETLAADQADLEAQLAALKAASKGAGNPWDVTLVLASFSDVALVNGSSASAATVGRYTRQVAWTRFKHFQHYLAGISCISRHCWTTPMGKKTRWRSFESPNSCVTVIFSWPQITADKPKQTLKTFWERRCI